MTPQKQAFLHAPDKGTWGDCWRTVIACVLDVDRDEVPHVVDGRDWDESRKAMDAYLAFHRLRHVALPFDPSGGLEAILRLMATANPGLHYLLMGTSKSGCNHVVVCRDGDIVWDTSITDAGIVGPADDGFYWIGFLGARL